MVYVISYDLLLLKRLFKACMSEALGKKVSLINILTHITTPLLSFHPNVSLNVILSWPCVCLFYYLPKRNSYTGLISMIKGLGLV